MGVELFDRFSLLHFSGGVLFYAINIDFIYTFLLHTIFEIMENSPFGVHFINTYLIFWPGGKKHSDILQNSVSDILFTAAGWIFAKNITVFYKIKNIYILLLSLGSILAYIEVRKTLNLIKQNAKN